MYPYTILINKERPLAPDYRPQNLVCADFAFAAAPDSEKRLLEKETALAAREMIADSQKQGLALYGISGYRSFVRQKELYEASTSGYVAPPGTSEHQSGLALDLSCPQVGLQLVEGFAQTPEGRWLYRCAPLYGFIIRYPREKETVTGYAWEPWHVRYVTRALSLYLSLTKMSLEEYWNI